MQVGLIGDTHMPRAARVLPDEVFAAFADCDLILHTGDLNTLDVLTQLEAIAPVRAVQGNTDPWEVAERCPETLTLVLDDVTVGLTHGHLGPGANTPDRARRQFPTARVVIFGHSHEPLIEDRAGVLLINPGSPTQPRRAPSRSVAVLTITAGEPSAVLITW